MPLHTWCHPGPCKQSSCIPSSSPLTGAELPQAKKKKKKSCFYACRVTSVVSGLCDPVDCGLPVFSVREGGSPGKNTGVHGPTLVAMPFQSTVFPAALAANTPEYLVLPEPLRPKQLQPPPHLALTGANPSPPGQPQEQTPVDDPCAEVEIKPQLKPRGSVAKEEDPKPSHQLDKLHVKSTRSSRQTLCLWYV